MIRRIFSNPLVTVLVVVSFLAIAEAETRNNTSILNKGVVMIEKASFAGGCFWCMTPPLEKLNGVIKVESGYTGGTSENPTYEDYAAKGHIEAVQVIYDPSKITYSQLLDVFWRQIDPIDPGGQFCDRGPQYRAAIFYFSEEQKRLAEKSKEDLDNSARYQKPIVTEIIKASTFYKAEDYHQDYHKKILFNTIFTGLIAAATGI